MDKTKRILCMFLWIYTISGVTVFELANSNDVCGPSFYNNETGTIRSPNFPDSYPANTRCIWVIEAPPGYKLNILFTDFNLQSRPNCDADYVRVSDGKSVEQKLCGSGVPEELNSGSRALEIEFVADSSIELRGFQLQFRRISLGPSDPNTCRVVLPGTLLGAIQIPFLPMQSYAPNTFCSWNISVRGGNRIQLRFVYVSLEVSPRCVNDYVVINDGATQVGPYCNGTLPPAYISENSAVEVVFYSDSALVSEGFRIEWQSLAGFCFGLPSIQNGEVSCTDDNRVGSICEHRCAEGLQILGENTSECVYSPTGVPGWTNNARRCVVSCGSSELKNGLTNCSNEQSVESICQFKCRDDHFLIGGTTSTCVRRNSFQAAWTPPLPSCLGIPIPSILMDYNVIPNDNIVTFRCMFAGFPMPLIEWKFENGTSLPQNSQFQVSPQQNASEYETFRELTVYGMSCQNTSLLRFQCFASNIHTSNPIQSGVFFAGLNITSLRFYDGEFSCEEAHLICQSIGAWLAIAPSSDILNTINSDDALASSNYWVSSRTQDFVDEWEEEPGFVSANLNGCIKVVQSQRVWARDQTSPSSVLCDRRPMPPRPRVSARKHICNGNILNVRWTSIRGAQSVPHLVHLSNGNRVYANAGVDAIIVDNLTANTEYEIQVIPLFDGCPSDQLVANASGTFSTGRNPVSPVGSVLFSRDVSENLCIISWQNRNNQENDIAHYEITLTKKPVHQRPNDVALMPEPKIIRLQSSEQEYVIQDLEPNSKYDIEISSAPRPPCDENNSIVRSPVFQGLCVTNPSVPESIPLSIQAPYVHENQVIVTMSAINETNGPISCYVLVIQKNSSQTSLPSSNNFIDLKQAGDAVGDDDPFIAFVTSKVDSLTEVVLGDNSLTCCDTATYDSESNCSEDSRKRRSSSSRIRAQNRRLPDGELFKYYVIATVPSGNSTLFAYSDVSMTFQKPQSGVDVVAPEGNDSGEPIFKIWYIFVISAAAVILILILILIIVCRRKSRKNKRTSAEKPTQVRTATTSLAAQMSPSTGPPEPAYCQPFVQFTAREFEDYIIPKADLKSAFIKKSADNNFLFKKEFKKILTGFPSPSTKYARQPECRDKNRNEEYLPSDQSRVQLESIGSGWGSDYINASFIDGFTSHRAFIAAQGPLEHTVEDFWKMILENHCTKIVMLTRVVESKWMKCESYWADVGKKEDFGNITVTTKSVKNIGHYIRREFVVKPKDHPNSYLVTQFQFMTWPDHDVPAVTSPVLRFREAVLSEHTDGTILVHGGVGGGRTGTFLALLILWEQLDRCNEMNAVEAIKKLREARTGLVENLKQYIYLHKLLCELTLLPASDCLASEFPKYFNRMKDVNITHTTNMKTEFDRLDEIAILHDESNIATRKSVKTSIKPYKRTEVSTDHILLQKGRKAIHSLHLSNVQTYNPDVYFLTAQSPSRSKFHAFWNCIWAFRITCVIRIEEKEKCSHNFFVGEGDKYAFDDVTVSLTKSEQHFGFLEKSLKIYKGGSSTPLCVQQIELTRWPVNGFPPNFHTIVSVASRVKNNRPSPANSKNSPQKFLALILCSDGSTRCGAFCAIFNLLDRLDRESRVDIFREVKDLRDCRPRLVGNIYQYEFIYQAIAEYIQEFNPYQEMQ